ncbi:MAG TPA: 4-phosphoerythronate dehydrogenase [Tenuifilaceae bacterium]|nr:4-phosphoerythronate dehydrogenase [Tenuifilaceae bacterium]HPJ45242.1 4-phosphoerythronate dehydrogenase [Tenuifilaceae bacterium]HPQ33363.1 4-phosphoerythronate dehydrogenase [Tenuifilaceae bacterium]HRX67552.1 4-phosphoerythronate dehydrogenase [Tenuifilaceae bacterium]
MNLLADIDIPFINGVFEPFVNSVVYKKGSDIQNNDVKNVDLLVIRTRTRCNEELLKDSKVSVIATATIGTDHIDLDYCRATGIKIFSAPGCNSAAVQQYVLAAIVEHIYTSNQSGKLTLGVVGVGNIGKLVCNIGNALGMKVLLNDPPRERVEGSSQFVSIETVAKESDIISFHVPFSKSGIDPTYNLADNLFFKNVKSNALIINTSRGGIVNEAELMQTNANKKISYILDVWENEPEINGNLLKNATIATPHIAGYSLEGKINATKMVVDSLFTYLGINEEWLPQIDSLEHNLYIDTTIYTDNKYIILEKILKEVYDIFADDWALRENPSNFEMLRNSYKYRRENSAYKVCVKSENQELFHMLGFNTYTDD